MDSVHNIQIWNTNRIEEEIEQQAIKMESGRNPKLFSPRKKKLTERYLNKTMDDPLATIGKKTVFQVNKPRDYVKDYIASHRSIIKDSSMSTAVTYANKKKDKMNVNAINADLNLNDKRYRSNAAFTKTFSSSKAYVSPSNSTR